MTLIKIGADKYFVSDTVENELKSFLHTYIVDDENSGVISLCNDVALAHINAALSADKCQKFLCFIDNIKKQAELKNNLFDNLYIAMKQDKDVFVSSLFSIKKPEAVGDTIPFIQIPKALLETNNITQYGRIDVVGRGEITLALILQNDTLLEPGGKYDIKIDNKYWHVKDATKTGINAATISTMGKRLLWDTNVWPLNILKKAGLDPMKLSTETIRPIATEIASQYIKKHGRQLLSEDGNIIIAQMFQDDLDKMFRESKVWGEAVGLVILENDKFHFVDKNQTYFGTMSGTGEPEFSLRRNRYKNVMIQELDINWPHETFDIEFQQEFEV